MFLRFESFEGLCKRICQNCQKCSDVSVPSTPSSPGTLSIPGTLRIPGTSGTLPRPSTLFFQYPWQPNTLGTLITPGTPITFGAPGTHGTRSVSSTPEILKMAIK